MTYFDDFLGWMDRVHPEFRSLKNSGLSETMVSPHVVGLPTAVFNEIREAVAAVERVVRPVQYATVAVSDSPEIARTPYPVDAVFTSFDFYITNDGPRLIEINTNAAGAVLVYLLHNWHQLPSSPATPAGFIDSVRDMFLSVMHQKGTPGDQPVIGIIDETPPLQKTRFDFELVADLMRTWDWTVVIGDPRDLIPTPAGASLNGHALSMIYNRFCDFYLESDLAAPMRKIYLGGKLPISPHPYEYALFADKSRLVQLGDPRFLSAIGATPDDIRRIQSVLPPVLRLKDHSADEIWAKRRSLFFKPARSFGAKSAYKGDGISKSVFQRLMDADTIAQPYFRPAPFKTNDSEYKYDVRVYTFRGEVQWVGARLFQGQLTNFKTPGGGFAPVTLL
ncbi:hypothetical protein EBR96_03375 [bacterium]|nr:hypothetical protein [bacterium]